MREFRKNGKQLLFDYMNPFPKPELYPGFDPSKINILVVGKSGTGKSSMVKAVALELSKTIFSLDLFSRYRTYF